VPRTADAGTAESAVRAYLTYLDDPSKLVDATRVKKLEAEAAKAKDPVDRVKAIAALHKAKSADPSDYEAAFIQYAQSWADAEAVPSSAFADLKVPKRVLDAAFGGTDGRKRPRKAAAAPRQHRTRTTPEAVEASILGLSGEFTIKDVIEASGSSTVTVRNAIDRLESQGRITPAGERSGNRGRAARTWALA
jgi:hypothetical protein